MKLISSAPMLIKFLPSHVATLNGIYDHKIPKKCTTMPHIENKCPNCHNSILFFSDPSASSCYKCRILVIYLDATEIKTHFISKMLYVNLAQFIKFSNT